MNKRFRVIIKFDEIICCVKAENSGEAANKVKKDIIGKKINEDDFYIDDIEEME